MFCCNIFLLYYTADGLIRYNKIQTLPNNILALKGQVEDILRDSKAEDIISINLNQKSDIADFMIIASGTSGRHTSMTALKLLDKLKENDPEIEYMVEGVADGEWVLVDLGDIIVHLFKPEIRELYQLEQMWS